MFQDIMIKSPNKEVRGLVGIRADRLGGGKRRRNRQRRRSKMKKKKKGNRRVKK